MPWVQAGLALLQTAGTVGSATVGEVIAHNHYNILAPQAAGAGDGVPQSSATSESQRVSTMATTGGANNLAAGRYVLFCVKY